ncbi:retinitis pigmentosa 9 protein-like isoform X2 [Oncorhynchus masou masou]|uniref:retinitis pigmentosa 9 protein-like isoform X2 n=1 Tax=Oncorhynchus masou masou TaxID=90313 RepID=UPI0031831CB9
MSLQCLVEKDRYTRRTEGTAKGTMNQNTMWKNSRNKRQKLNQEVQKLKHVKTKTTNQRTIPADPGSEDARDFLAQAPTKGLWMPHGKGVKVMQCWRCSVIDTGQGTESVPSSSKETRSWSSSEWIQQLQQLLQDATSSSDSSSSTSESKKRKHKKKKEKKKKKHHKFSKTSDCSESD